MYGKFICIILKKLNLSRGAHVFLFPTAPVKNPQANAICERVHHTVVDILRVFVHVNPPQANARATQLMDNALSTCMHASRCAVNAALQASPGSLIFNRDMLVDLPLTSNLLALQQLRQQGINKALLRDNAKRKEHTFKLNDKVWMQEPDPDKLQPRKAGPFTIAQVHDNGTVKIQKTPSVVETVNIQKLTPYREPTPVDQAEPATIHWSA